MSEEKIDKGFFFVSGFFCGASIAYAVCHLMMVFS